MNTMTAKCVYAFILLAVVVTGSTGRPQNSIDSQDDGEYEPNLSDFQSSYYSYPSQVMVDSVPLEKLQMLVAQIKPNPFIRSLSSSGPSIDAVYRLPLSKRQVRYRQCYFNPISCFKK